MAEEDSWPKDKAASEPSEWNDERSGPLKVKASSGGQSSDDPARRRKLRELNKRLRTILEDGGIDYGEEDVDGEEVINRFKVAVKSRRKGIILVMKEIKRSRNVDLCFLVDATGSMQPHIDGVRKSITKIVDCLTNTTKQATLANQPGAVSKLRLAFVAYRDHYDKKQFEVLDFVESIPKFRSFCASIRAEGGEDEPEDVFGGLNKTLQLGWSDSSGTKVIFHIADAPCHGRLFTSAADDTYPDGDPKGRTHKALFNLLRDNGIQYYFGKINSSTDKMMELFSHAYGETITDFDVKDVEKISSSVIGAVLISVSSSISTNKATGGVKRQKRSYIIDPLIPDWSRERR